MDATGEVEMVSRLPIDRSERCFRGLRVCDEGKTPLVADGGGEAAWMVEGEEGAEGGPASVPLGPIDRSILMRSSYVSCCDTRNK